MNSIETVRMFLFLKSTLSHNKTEHPGFCCTENHRVLSPFSSSSPRRSFLKVQGLNIPSSNIHKLYSAAVPPQSSPLLMCSPSSARGSIPRIQQTQNDTLLLSSLLSFSPLFFPRITSSSSPLPQSSAQSVMAGVSPERSNTVQVSSCTKSQSDCGH